MSSQEKEPLRILRFFWRNSALTARVFEENFQQVLGEILPVLTLEQPRSWEDFFARPSEAGAFFSPNYELQPLVPWLLSLRNAAESSLRLLFIAHAPGGMPWIWKLLPPLLRRGDRIVAPSAHAAQVIRWFTPELVPAIRVIPHPIPVPLQDNSSEAPGISPGEHFLALGRLRPEKCLHQLLEGYALFCQRHRKPGKTPSSLVIAGPHVDEERGGPLAYLLALRQRARRLGVEQRVFFPGAVRGAAREELFRTCRGVCALSLSLEESFGKTPAEALARGIPVLATRWSAFPELLGSGGVLLSPLWEGEEETPSLDPRQIAEALEVLSDLPRHGDSEKEHVPWSPHMVQHGYREMLLEALEEERPPVAEDERHQGVLARTAPLNVLSGKELFEYHRSDCQRRLRRMKGERVEGYSEAEEIQGILELALRKSLGLLFAHQPLPASSVSDSENISKEPHFPEKEKREPQREHPYLRGGLSSEALPSSRIACALALAERGKLQEARQILESLDISPPFPPLEAYALCRIAMLEEKWDLAWSLWKSRNASWKSREEGGRWLALGARIVRKMEEETMKEFFSFLEPWLRAFPDAPESGRAALEGAVTALEGGEPFRGKAYAFAEQARLLMGDSPLISRVELALLGYLS
jgi:glycosyltransferase involved in cell wall biosynthesis